MARSLAGRAGLGRPFAPAAPSRARSSRGNASARRWPGLQAPRLRAGLEFLAARRRLRIALAVLALLAVLLCGGWVWLRHSSLVAVQRVQISGVHGPDAGAIDAALEGAARHMSTLDVRVGRLRAAVAAFPLVRDVQASASFPHGLRIRVREQLPVAALEAAGTRTAVAADGVVLGPALLSGALPILAASSTPMPGQRLADGALQEDLTVLGAAPVALARFVSKAYNGPQGVTVVMRSGLAAYFGDAGRPHAKWLALALVLANERSAGASYVDVRVPGRPAAGYAPGTAPPRATGTTSGNSTSAGAGTAEATAAALAAAVGREGGPSASGQPHGVGEESSSASSGEAGSSSPEARSSTPEARSSTPESGGGTGSEAPNGGAQTGH